MTSISGKRAWFWVPLLVVVVLDFATKRWAEAALFPVHVPHDVIGEFLRFTLAYNPGAAFGIHAGPLSRLLFTGLSLVVLLFLVQLYRETPPSDVGRVFALGLVCGGAVGNLIDRLRSPRGVVDFIDIGVGGLRFWTFNIADSAVTIGAILLAWSLWREPARTIPE